MIQPNDTVLFQGDSITDCGRDREQCQANSLPGLGRGYALLTASALLANHPGKNLQVLNRGISGNRVVELAQRWQADCLALKPTVLSILIGVNDTWHGLKTDSDRRVPLPQYEQTYRQLLQQARQAQPSLRLVLCEPFALRCGAVTDDWFPELDDRRAIVQKLAREFGAAFVAFQAAFDQACQKAEPTYWAADGVHPTPAGHHLMAQSWLAAVNDG